jgi:serine/threonine protein kinase
VFPIVVMDWIEGDPLGVWLDKHSTNRDALIKARAHFREMAEFLEENNIAHGDIQNGNVIMTPYGVKLIDYDGMYVPGLPVGKGSEEGHKHFQHPQRTTRDYGPLMDRFSFIVIDLSLSALVEDSTLHRRFGAGGEGIVFKANDFAAPRNSDVFRVLASNASLAKSIAHFRAICESEINDVPSLQEFIQGLHIPIPSSMGVSRSLHLQAGAGLKYISAFPVVDAKLYTIAALYIGKRIELIGKIVEVREGRGKYGRGKNRRYIFVNFGDWRGDIVKLTFWENALERITEQPSKSWAGRWVSVTGLLDPPYKNARWGYSHLSISIHDGGQINVIDERQALFRLGKLALVANVERGLDVKPISPAQPSSQSIRNKISNGPQTVAAKAAAISKNQELVRKYVGSPAALTQSQATTTPSSPVVAASSQSGSQTQAASTTLLNSMRLLVVNFKWPVWMLCIGVVFAFASQSSNKQVSERKREAPARYLDSGSSGDPANHSSSVVLSKPDSYSSIGTLRMAPSESQRTSSVKSTAVTADAIMSQVEKSVSKPLEIETQVPAASYSANATSDQASKSPLVDQSDAILAAPPLPPAIELQGGPRPYGIEDLRTGSLLSAGAAEVLSEKKTEAPIFNGKEEHTQEGAAQSFVGDGL